MTKKTKRTARRAMIAGVAAGGLTAVAAGTARAAIIYADNFDGTAGLVSGRSVTTATGLFGGTAGATWTSDAVVGSPNPDALWNASGGTYSGTGTTDASVGTFTTGADANQITNAYLPFVPQSGLIYDAHIALGSSGVGASGNWLGMTFAPTNLNGHTSGGGSSALSNMAGAGLIIDKGSGQVQSFGGVGTANGAINTAAGFIAQGTTTPTYHTFDILLDTTGVQWVVSWLIDGVAPSGVGPTSFTYTTNPSIGNIVFGSNKLTGAASDFSLTTVPEPGSMMMLGLGALVLTRRRGRATRN
jgi:hypothetical protein